MLLLAGRFRELAPAACVHHRHEAEAAGRRAARHLAERPPYVIDDALRRRPRSPGKVNVGSGGGERGDDKLGRLCRLIDPPEDVGPYLH